MQLLKEMVSVFIGLAMVVLSALAIMLVPIIILLTLTWVALEVLFS